MGSYVSSEARIEREWHDPPLAVAVNQFLSAQPWAETTLRQEIIAHLQLRNLKPNLLAEHLRDWSLCCLLMQDEEDLGPMFISSLSDTQAGSFRILLEWWTGRIQDMSLSAAAIAIVVIGSVEQIPQQGRNLFTKSTESSYHRALWQLFRMEFGIVEKPSSSFVFPDLLPRTRNYAATSACTQRIGSLCYSQAGTESSGNAPDFHTFRGSIITAVNEIMSNLKSSEQVPTADLHKNLERSFIAATWWPYRAGQRSALVPSQSSLGAVLEPCPWLSVEDKSRRFPRFLWDVPDCRTVDTLQLEHYPQYTAISHTWGRWRYKEKPAIAVAGALWLIPQNSRFEVEKIPEILSTVPAGTRYIWFDLVCIPQELTRPDMAKIASEEIASQASIFCQADRAIAWFNDIHGFEGLETVARLMALSLFECPAGMLGNFDEFEEETLNAATTASPTLLDPTLSYSEANGRGISDAINGWLTSLWTLQEACLRPDMLLCTRNWSVLQVVNNIPLQLDGLISLVQQVSFDRLVDSATGPWPTAVKKRILDPNQALEAVQMVILAIQLSGMSGLLDATRNEILWLGDRRFCQDSRAEAIMSVLGATEWYKGYTDQRARPKLVLGKYTLAFVENARRTIGAMFFGSMITKQIVRDMIAGEIRAGEKEIGSMMPFGAAEIPSFKGPQILEHGCPLEHPSVASWKIHEDGSVRISEVGILTSTDTTTRTRMEAFIMDLSKVTPTSTRPDLTFAPSRTFIDLRRWVLEQQYVCYAVCLVYRHDYDETQNYRECRRYDGILLREIQKGYLVKFGVFTTMLTPISQNVPPTTEVDWVVL